MIADKIVFEVLLDRETHDKLKKKTGISAMNGREFLRAVIALLNANDATEKSNGAYHSMKERIKEEAQVFANMEKPDNVNNPAHYTQGGIECIDAIRASMTVDEFAGFLKGNAVKYLWRYRHKGKAAEDLKKARWYIDRLIEHTEGKKND